MSLDLTFIVNQVDLEVSAPVRINVKYPREQVTYRSSSNRDNVNISYVRLPTITSRNAVFVSDAIRTLPENRPPSLSSTVEFTGTSAEIAFASFLVTDVFTTATSSLPATPLFYKYTLPSGILNAGESAVDADILSSTLQTVKLAEYVEDLGAKTIYFNVKNSLDLDTGVSDVSYVKFTLRNGSGVVRTVTQLLESQPIFHAATYEDIDTWANLIEGSDAYLIEDSTSGPDTIKLPPPSRKFGIRELEQNGLEILPPKLTSIKDPWFCSVTNGDLVSTFDGTSYRYRIAEFDDQAFDPLPPYKTSVTEDAVVLGPHLIKVARENLAVDEDAGYHLRILIRDADENLKAAVSSAVSDHEDVAGSDEDGDPVTYTGGLYLIGTEGIRSVDRVSGFIDVLNTLLVDDIVEVTYIYEELEYEITDINLNPRLNPDILDQRVVVYIIPEAGATYSESLRYLLVDTQTNLIVASNDEVTEIATSGIQELIDAGGFSYETKAGYTSFVDSATTDNDDNSLQRLVLGEIGVGEPIGEQDFVIFDARIQGGGIKPELFDTKPTLRGFRHLMWDSGALDGKPFPGAGAFYVEVPHSVRQDRDGIFSDQAVQAVIERHMALGCYPIRQFYGDDPVISGVNTLVSGVDLSWSQQPGDPLYNVYYSTGLDSVFDLANLAPLDQVDPNVLTVSGLSGATTYYAYVENINESGTLIGKSKIVKFTTGE